MKKEEEKFQQIVYMNHKLEVLIYLIDVLNSAFDKVFTIKLICEVLKKVDATFDFLPSFFYFSK